MKIVFTKAYLNRMSIHNLRTLGRLVSAPQPSDESKNDLIDKILGVMAGDIPHSHETRGRKPKGLILSIEDMLKSFPPLPSEDETGCLKQYYARPFVPEVKLEELNGDSRVQGILDICADGFGFLRTKNFCAGDEDVFVPASQIDRFGLRSGDCISASIRSFDDNKVPSVVFVHTVNDLDASNLTARKNFANMSAVFPFERLKLETKGNPTDLTLRAIDLISPIGKGQRGLIVSPPKAGKTALIKKLASAILTNNPEVHLIVLLIDERPEEVTDFRTSLNCEVAATTFDQSATQHVAVSELALNRAKRLVEAGRDVVILMDSLTRLARAHNHVVESCRNLAESVDTSAMTEPKRFFASARKVPDGGSLTIIATAHVDSGNKMDASVFEELNDTGNMELHLNKKTTVKHLFPSIDFSRSGTKREHLLVDEREFSAMRKARKLFANFDESQHSEKFLELLAKSSTNEMFFEDFEKISDLQNL